MSCEKWQWAAGHGYVDPGSDTIHYGEQGCVEHGIFLPVGLFVKCHQTQADTSTCLLTARACMRFCTICFFHFTGSPHTIHARSQLLQWFY